MRTILGFALAAAALAGAAAPVDATQASAYRTQNSQEVCGYLPYRAAGPDRFAEARPQPETTAKIGSQATYPFAWDLARPAFLAAEVAEDLLEGQPLDTVRHAHDSALSLGEYMLFAARKFEQTPARPTTTDERMLLAAERPETFHRLYMHAKTSYEGVAAYLTPNAPAPDASIEALAQAWRPAYALAAKAQADDKRIELLSTDLDADAIAEKEAVACLAHAVALLAAREDAAATALAQTAAARWPTRPAVNARALPRSARGAFFDYEDAGDDLAAAIAALPPAPADTAAMQTVAKRYAEFVAAAKDLHAATRAKPQ